VNFWASWCIPCLHEIPSLIEVAKKFSTKELVVVTINTDEEDQLKNIAKIKKQLSFPESFLIIPDKKFKIADEFKFSAIPVTIIFKKGKAIYFNNGPVDFLKVLPDYLVSK
jgi:thiol-disulfide isomerase/thioredoxin